VTDVVTTASLEMNANSSSLPAVVENALVVTVNDGIAWSPHTTASIAGGAPLEFATVTLIDDDVV
jgi:hypothetical protein